MKKPVVLFGVGQIAAVVHSYVSYDSDWTIAGFTVDRAYQNCDEFLGLPVVPFEDVEKTFPPADYAMFIVVSYRGMNRLRQRKYTEAKSKGYEMPSYVSSRALVLPHAVVGDNCFVGDKVSIQPYASIGDNVEIWCGSTIGHHSIVEDHCFVAGHVVVGSTARIGSRCFIGMHSTVSEGVNVAEDCLIGARGLILRHTAVRGVYLTEGTQLFPKRSDKFGELFPNSPFASTDTTSG